MFMIVDASSDFSCVHFIDYRYPVLSVLLKLLCNSFNMGCPPVRVDNPRALASGLSNVQVDKHGINILYLQYQCRPCTS